ERVAVDARAVEALQVAQPPAAVGVVDLGVLAAAQLVLQDDAVGRRPAEGEALPGDERVDVAEPVVTAGHQGGRSGGNHSCVWVLWWGAGESSDTLREPGRGGCGRGGSSPGAPSPRRGEGSGVRGRREPGWGERETTSEKFAPLTPDPSPTRGEEARGRQNH